MVVVVVDLLEAWDRVRSGGGRVGVVVVSATVLVTLVVHLPPAQFGVVRVGAVVRSGGVVVTFCCCCEEREATVLCPRDGGGVPLLRTVVLTSSGRGARVDEDVLSSFGVMRKAVVRLLRGGEVSRGGPPGRSVPLG